MPAHSSETDASSRNKRIAGETVEAGRHGGCTEPLAHCGWAERYEEGCPQWQQFRLGFSLVRSSLNEMTRHLSQQLPTTVLPSSLSAASTVSYVFGNSLKENEQQWPQPLCAPIRARACGIQDGIEEEGPRKLQEDYPSRIEAMHWRSTGEAAHLAATAGLESHTAVP